ncbi:hypothetical protein MTR67_021989 [Solanum verrucosum]|uniref:Uncharacterized protein n=1 Tax=Solanum verrucosum TaxID=315347 RepID=A0AAF0QR14_SOLVR|nr:hypothetical protein MTR67_021989 [Solanum verrucosum]
MPHLCKLRNNFVKVLKSRRMDLHATFMQVVQQLGEGVEIEEIGNPTTEVIASKQSSTTNHPRVYCVDQLTGALPADGLVLSRDILSLFDFLIAFGYHALVANGSVGLGRA